ncbi:uncharacterized protein LOC124459429 [Xenia sp. Carnegie-2017]|uniref:uncharacterized protein LOC124459429 n=1 Tax=Xenia sp. Carnegie-2017 TaxID=2897299 RepID=UPI001F03838E|nr:uncharacterized protein LOC124459429 [Xenia sp. Carnegie-2017]
MRKYLVILALSCLMVTTSILIMKRLNNTRIYTHVGEDFTELNTNVQSKIETFVLFVGYPRSGTTIMAALLDAHPHIIISNELNVFQRWTEWTNEMKTRSHLINELYKNSYFQTQGSGYRSPTKSHGRKFAVPHQWQGTFKHIIKVIGDKKSGKNSKIFWETPQLVKEVLQEVNLPMKIIHMVRNPFDNIATMTMRSLKINPYHVKTKVNDTKALERNINLYLNSVRRNVLTIKKHGSSVITVHSEDVIHQPHNTLLNLCKFLQVSCSEDYLHDCASVLYKSTSKTREKVIWTETQKLIVQDAIRRVQFLSGYTIES